MHSVAAAVVLTCVLLDTITMALMVQHIRAVRRVFVLYSYSYLFSLQLNLLAILLVSLVSLSISDLVGLLCTRSLALLFWDRVRHCFAGHFAVWLGTTLLEARTRNSLGEQQSKLPGQDSVGARILLDVQVLWESQIVYYSFVQQYNHRITKVRRCCLHFSRKVQAACEFDFPSALWCFSVHWKDEDVVYILHKLYFKAYHRFHKRLFFVIIADTEIALK